MRLPVKAQITTGMKNLEKREVRSHNKVRALFAENKCVLHAWNNYVFL